MMLPFPFVWRSRWASTRIERSANGLPKLVHVQFVSRNQKKLWHGSNKQVLRSDVSRSTFPGEWLFRFVSNRVLGTASLFPQADSKILTENALPKIFRPCNHRVRSVVECWRHNFGREHGFGCGLSRGLSLFRDSVTNSFFLR